MTGGDVHGGGSSGETVGQSVRGGDVTGGTAKAGRATSGESTATATVNGRRITAKSRGDSVSIQSADGKAMISVGDHRLTVEDSRLLVNDVERAKFDAQAEEIELELIAGKVSLTVDGARKLDEEL